MEKDRKRVNERISYLINKLIKIVAFLFGAIVVFVVMIVVYHLAQEVLTPEEKIGENIRHAVPRQNQDSAWSDFLEIDCRNAANHVEEFCVVSGKIENVNVTNKETYLNFDKNWKNHFSFCVVIYPEYYGNFTYDIKKLEGKKVKLTGRIIQPENRRPHIELKSPKNIKVLG